MEINKNLANDTEQLRYRVSIPKYPTRRFTH